MTVTAFCLAPRVNPLALETVMAATAPRFFVALNHDYRAPEDFAGWRDAVESSMRRVGTSNTTSGCSPFDASSQPDETPNIGLRLFESFDETMAPRTRPWRVEAGDSMTRAQRR